MAANYPATRTRPALIGRSFALPRVRRACERIGSSQCATSPGRVNQRRPQGRFIRRWAEFPISVRQSRRISRDKLTIYLDCAEFGHALLRRQNRDQPDGVWSLTSRRTGLQFPNAPPPSSVAQPFDATALRPMIGRSTVSLAATRFLRSRKGFSQRRQLSDATPYNATSQIAVCP